MADYCPEIAGNSTANGYYGCPDDDGDGIPNMFEFEESEIDSDNDGRSLDNLEIFRNKKSITTKKKSGYIGLWLKTPSIITT